ncbi:unnamed protein product, partial [Coregonus sp. 'balchen']
LTVQFGPKKEVILAGYKTVKQALVNHAEEFGDRGVTRILVEKDETLFPDEPSGLWNGQERGMGFEFFEAQFQGMVDRANDSLRLTEEISMIIGSRQALVENRKNLPYTDAVIHRFCFSPPPGVTEDDLDLTPSLGFTLTPSPHQLCAVSRV